ncbi:5-hydroxyisourate hydrolase OS=Tsukamurella paurometabola (strain ATCC 8368 / DSM / CCUG 35730/ CIP 100753 / JCM 10117 / KCTC 9821 / NBRC 16120 / NCIMB 702349 / NCTC 13040) OX=521096 GN=Tpau_2961 PE=3 SV=1 [Tsukamurella paurometabola]|uniref:5-hydroxyisourate hydrolase n=1 Tax=Tsukamurella paurometabola (strain ATCC 8368 / DSM 20162 / CCUG 35730 / CIP 100753 / JCM 10117 / KCTC 9821 / NBRC 16120 / NCIMB 702349 / NCTC 13040) TaxID=521096 RepID=D5UU54_TSUPD|nr:hydroxyisourate hydrolase [Tsukamurella paurometabola]ADG79557.1 hydroxyisourate hydrolase [Tsukamurella paurometabola DSM 20162]SUP36225.1 5-hydroxyisourate hydrolase precursor [Tsukamurella paurometabola]
MSRITTHILDAVQGSPAAGVETVLARPGGPEIARGRTDADGRLALGPDDLPDGDYQLRFDTGRYFAESGRASFHPSVTIAFTVADAPHYHVPLLLSPYSYTTYRGS